MNILYPIGAFYPSQLGGPNNTVYWMTKALQAKGTSATIVTTHRGIQDKQIQFDKWLDTDYGKINYLKVLHRKLPIKICINSIAQLSKVDIVHLTSIFYSGSLPMALMSLLKGKKVIWSIRGELDPAALSFHSIEKKVILAVVKKISSKITFHSTSDPETAYIKNTFGTKSAIVQLPNYMELPQQVNRKPEKYLFFIGRIHQIKGIDLLIKALAKSQVFLNSKYILKIAGDDNTDFGIELKALIKQLNINHKVELIGYVNDQDEKQQLLANAYFLFLPSHSENFGNVVIEALAQQTPVVASKGTPWEVLETKQAGFWVENSVEKLSNTIDRILNLDKKTYQNYRINAGELVKKNYDIEQNIDKWITAYSNLANNKSNLSLKNAR